MKKFLILKSDVSPCHLDKETRKSAKEEGREAIENGLFLFSVSRLRIPKTPDFC